MPCELINFVIAFAPLFSKPVFERVKVLLVGAILSPVSRTVSNALRVMGLSQDHHFENYHRVLNRDQWSSLKSSQILLNLLIKAFGLTDELVIGFDDHLERRWGEKIKARGIRHRRLTDRARQAILLIKRWLPQLDLVLVGDSSFAALDLLNSVKDEVTVVSRIRLDAALSRKARARRKGQMGRGRKKGKRLPTLQAVIDHPKTKWKPLTIGNWYGEKNRKIEIVSGKCVWYHVGKQAVEIRWVIIRDPFGEFETQAVLSTRVEATPKKIVEWFVLRWQVEVTFEESRRHLGIETQRQWSDKAIQRTTPSLFGLFSLITMMAQELCKGGKLKIRSAVWYHKEVATFSDAIGCVRQQLWEFESFQTSEKEVEMIKIPRAFLETLTETLCFAT